MFVLRRYASLRRLQVVLGLALMGLCAPSASAQALLDAVNVTGSGGSFSNINIKAQSGTSGQSPSGTISFTVFGSVNFTGSVTCLNVTGPDRGGGTSTAPTTAVVTAVGTGPNPDTTFKVLVVDYGGGGADTFAFASASGPTECALPSPNEVSLLSTLTNGRAVVFDAPLLPTSKEQCKNGGWQNFPQFKNQGDCVSFVATNGKNQPG